MIELTQSIVKELLTYNPDTGELRWKRRARRWFKSDHDWRSWNTRLAGKHAFTTFDRYCNGAIFNKRYRAHRIIFLWMVGRWPQEMDHANRKTTDNRWTDLREVSHQLNGQNQSQHKRNTSGRTGVYVERGRYRAEIYVAGRKHCLGTFPTLAEAAVAREAAERRFGFSLGHGRPRLRLRRAST